jgi:hypothetical protein
VQRKKVEKLPPATMPRIKFRQSCRKKYVAYRTKEAYALTIVGMHSIGFGG